MEEDFERAPAHFIGPGKPLSLSNVPVLRQDGIRLNNKWKLSTYTKLPGIYGETTEADILWCEAGKEDEYYIRPVRQYHSAVFEDIFGFKAHAYDPHRVVLCRKL